MPADVTSAERPSGAHGEVYRRADLRWAWRFLAGNGEIVATDGGQGFENRGDALASLRLLLCGIYAGAPIETLPERSPL